MTSPLADDRLIVAMDVPNAIAGLKLAEQLGDAVSFYKIGLGMLTGGGLALAEGVATFGLLAVVFCSGRFHRLPVVAAAVATETSEDPSGSRSNLHEVFGARSGQAIRIDRGIGR